MDKKKDETANIQKSEPTHGPEEGCGEESVFFIFQHTLSINMAGWDIFIYIFFI